jgi:hypothetical protein
MDNLFFNWQDRYVTSIDYNTAKTFTLRYHYSDLFPTAAKYKYGLVDNGELVGACIFGTPVGPFISVSCVGEHNKILELQRLALKYNRPNEASWFVSRCLKMLPWEGIVVSYADTEYEHHGGVYQALGFNYSGLTQERTDIYSEGHSRHHLGDIAKRMPRSTKHRYWLSIPRGKHDHTVLWESLPYPKPQKKIQETMKSIKKHLSPDLLKPEYRGNDNPYYGHCYVATEALYHLLGGEKSGLYPVRARDDKGVVHWWLEDDDGNIYDPTREQYAFSNPPYDKGKRGGFLTKTPSKRTSKLISRIQP